MLKWLVLSSLLACACGSDDVDDPQRQDAGLPDAGVVEDLTQLDLSLDTGAEDLGPDLVATLDWVSVQLSDGSLIEGELIATYELIRWWQGGEGLLYAIFDPKKFRDYPNDSSITFVPSIEVEAISPASGSPPSYRQFLRDRDIFIQRPPFEDVSFVLTGNDSYHLEEDGFGDYAWDFEITDSTGRRFLGTGAANEDYLAWDQPVFSGVSGEVIDVVSTSADNTPGEHPATSEAVNNWVGIALGGSYYVYYLHFRQDGIDPSIRVGSWVRTGDLLGRAGNSGVTLEPHIHVVLLWYDAATDRSYSIPISFETVDVSQTPQGPFWPHPEWTPTTGEWLRDTR